LGRESSLAKGADELDRLRAALELEPKDPELRGRLGVALYELGFQTEAIGHLKFATRYSKTPEEWRQRLRRVVNEGLKRPDRLRLENAFIALAAGRASEALADFQDLAATRPRNPAVQLGLRGALHALGRAGEVAEAAARWRRASPPHRAGVEAALARPMSRRGLVFDPREPLPVRPLQDVLTRVGSAEELRQTPNAYLEIDARKLPIDCDPVIPLAPDGSDAITLNDQTGRRLMARFDDALLVGAGLVVTRAGEVVSNLQVERNYRAEVSDGTLRFPPGYLQDGAGAPRVFDAPALLMAGPVDRSYGDWINQYPPRLAIAETAGLNCPPVVRSDLGDRYVQMLAALGVDPDRLLRHGHVSIFPQLYVSSWPLDIRREPMPGWFEVYRRAWAPAPVERKRIYLSRRGIAHRPLVNEAEIAELFARRGFDIVAPETLDMGEMIKLFAGPSVVAGPYGSAMRGLVFSRQKPTLFALMPPYHDNFVEGSALWVGQTGARFAWVRGTPLPGNESADPNETAWTIDAALVESRLERLLDYLADNAEVSEGLRS
jgi:tetratricopeptide (TPR) repeat protein